MKGKDYDVASEIRKIKPEPTESKDIEITEEVTFQEETSYAEPLTDVFASQEDHSTQAVKTEIVDEPYEETYEEPDVRYESIEDDEDYQEGFVDDNSQIVHDQDDDPEDNKLFFQSAGMVQVHHSIIDVGVPWKNFVKRVIQDYPMVKKVPRNTQILAELDLQCEVCGIATDDLEEHVNSTHVARNLQSSFCNECNERFKKHPGLRHFDVHRVFNVCRRCPYCQRSYENVRDYKGHLEAHFFSGIGAACTVCGEGFLQEREVQFHIAREHMNRFVCPKCLLVFEDKKCYEEHLKEERIDLKPRRGRPPKYTLGDPRRRRSRKPAVSTTTGTTLTASTMVKIKREPGARYEDVSTLSSDKRTPMKDRIGYCSACTKHVPDYLNHLIENHFSETEDGMFMCSMCTSKTNSKHAARAHFNLKHRMFEHPQRCPICNLEFQLESEFKKHLADHEPPKSRQVFECDHCPNAKYTSKASLRFHIVSHHSQNKICKYCMKEFDNEEVYYAHIEKEKLRVLRNVHVCDICGFGTRHKRYLHDHVIRRHGDHGQFVQCDECGKWCKSPMNLKDHKLNKHREKTIECTICGKRHRNNALLREHMRASHPTSQVTCEICGKQMNPIHLKRHRFLAHSASRPHECRVCSMTFKTRAVLLKHMHSHAGTRPYNCNTCHQGYYTRGLLGKHYLQAHNIQYTDAELRTLCKRQPSALEMEEKAQSGQLM